MTDKLKMDKPRPSLYPVPVTLVTCGSPVNIITISWTGILCTQPPLLYISVRPERHSYELIKSSGRFCINLANESMLIAADICGNTSGRVVDKPVALGLKLVDLLEGFPPAIAQCPHHLFCETRQIMELGTHHAFVAEVVGEFMEATVFQKDHHFDYTQLKPLCYCRKYYFSLGVKLGTYGFTSSPD
jgi:flavin reductase (DIM6/NTAB) family NADH-FMN oxidoreductase RutF